MLNTNCIILVVLTIIIFYLVQDKDKDKNKEGFYNVPDYSDNSYWNPDWVGASELHSVTNSPYSSPYSRAVGKRSLDCYEHNKKDCMKYSNCGLCLKDRKMQCIPGDVQGPLFKEDCEGWVYTDYHDRYIFGEKVVNMSPPWSKFYSEYGARYPSPTSRATLQ